MPLDKNLTGEQIQQMLDLFLYKAIEPVILNSDIFDYQVSYILGLISTNRKRKPSSLPRDKIIALLCFYLASDSREEKFAILKTAHIERCFLHVFLSKLTKEYADYVPLYKSMLMADNPTEIRRALDDRAARIGCNRQEVYRIMNVSLPYLNAFYRCRTSVLDHYLKLASRQAKARINSGKGNFDFFDVRQSILKSILMALDKYDSSKGALTSYINWWVFNAQTCNVSDHEYGVAYTIPQTYRRKIARKDSDTVNYAISMDDSSSDDSKKSLHSILGNKQDLVRDLEHKEEIDMVCYLAKCVDTRGIARLTLDIGEVFSDRERYTMSEQTRLELQQTVKEQHNHNERRV